MIPQAMPTTPSAPSDLLAQVANPHSAPPQPPQVVQALLDAERAAKHPRPALAVERLLGQWQLRFTAPKKPAYKAGEPIGKGFYWPAFAPGTITFSCPDVASDDAEAASLSLETPASGTTVSDCSIADHPIADRSLTADNPTADNSAADRSLTADNSTANNSAADNSAADRSTADRRLPEPLTIENQIRFGPLALKFSGPAKFLAKQNLLAFDFVQLQVLVGGTPLLNVPLKGRIDPDAFAHTAIAKLPFFAFFAATDQYLAARGRGGGLALWVKA